MCGHVFSSDLYHKFKFIQNISRNIPFDNGQARYPESGSGLSDLSILDSCV